MDGKEIMVRKLTGFRILLEIPSSPGWVAQPPSL